MNVVCIKLRMITEMENTMFGKIMKILANLKENEGQKGQKIK